jgi:tRNA dimethylallyltransferase
MNVGTAKPTVTDQAQVRHWLLDVALPGERFTAADFKAYAEQKITEIRERGHVPFLVGGTGLYIDSVVFDFQFATAPDESFRQRLNDMSVSELQKYCKENNVLLPENKNNKRYLVRTIERKSVSAMRRDAPDDTTHVVGIATTNDVLRTRIEYRSEQLFANNVVKEATLLGEKYGWESEAMTGNIYPLVHEYLCGAIDEAELKRRFVVSDWRLAKRQMTWLRRNEHMMWADVPAAEHYLSTLLLRG